MRFGETVRRQRAARRMTQAQLAAAVGVNKRQIQRYEADEAQPALAVAITLARILGISLDALVGEPDQPPHR